jgi:2-polyprenyl-3-methyl-5-hydroxy-6-metoxy-1,4-benzoquinol methylase
MDETFEPQYSMYYETKEKMGVSSLGLSSNNTWHSDSSRLAFVLSRYKFVSRMFENYEQVLEIGCGDGFASKIVADKVRSLVLSDIDPLFVEEAQRINTNTNMQFRCIDFVKDFTREPFDGIFALDVFEHINPESENIFLRNIVKSMAKSGVLIIGIPSLESQKYASDISRKGHVNCKSKFDLQNSLKKHFTNVFTFSMNDEVLHTGFHGMSHYLICLASGPQIDVFE